MLARQKCEMQQLSHPKFQLQMYKKINVNFFFFFSWKPILKDFIFTLKTSNIMLQEEKRKKGSNISGKGWIFREKNSKSNQKNLRCPAKDTDTTQKKWESPILSLLPKGACGTCPAHWSPTFRSESESHNVDARQGTSSTWAIKNLEGRIQPHLYSASIWLI